ncbi:uncharacterized protein LOC142786394 isoform X2 [Rhipicephalus microplus]|uniref:uncharacterized protein LOC142786394 isoform X2 n=1 Tax=Rhipicephalus microplus TaxID=6941 RepID=UPI003F6BF7D3
MKALHATLFLGIAASVVCAYWSSDYREHAQCLAYCWPDYPQYSRCGAGCLCYRRFDYPQSGYCLDPKRPIPDHFRMLGARYKPSN